MSVLTYVCDSTIVCAPSPANDNGTTIALDLWDLTEEVRVCADLSGSLEDYQRSLFRFSKEQRLLFAGLAYLDCVQRKGHSAYFSSALSNGFEDAVSCFRACGSHAIADAMEEACQQQNVTSVWTDGSVVMQQTGLDANDHVVAHNLPLDNLRGFVRRHAASFERW